jgi:phage-related protein
MTSPSSTDIKEIIFFPRQVVECLRDEFPARIRDVMVERLHALQNGIRLPDQHNRSLTPQAPGIHEIRVNFNNYAYRVYHASEFAEVIYVVEAHLKKPTKGVGIPQADLDRMVGRLKAARVNYQENRLLLQHRFEERALRRRSFDDGTAQLSPHEIQVQRPRMAMN